MTTYEKTIYIERRFNPEEIAAWHRMNDQCCGKCGTPLRPCPKGPGADEPGFCGFFQCAYCQSLAAGLGGRA